MFVNAYIKIIIYPILDEMDSIWVNKTCQDMALGLKGITIRLITGL